MKEILSVWRFFHRRKQAAPETEIYRHPPSYTLSIVNEWMCEWSSKAESKRRIKETASQLPEFRRFRTNIQEMARSIRMVSANDARGADMLTPLQDACDRFPIGM